jgi:hypothetical protein
LIELLDLRLHRVVISPLYGDAADNENADREERKAEMKTMQEKMDANQAKTDANREADREERK